MKQDHIQHNLKCLFNGPDPCRTRAARYLKVLAHPARMKILWYLNDSEKSVNDLVNYTNIKQTTLSQHLSLLKDRELWNHEGKDPTFFTGFSTRRSWTFSP